MSIDSAPVVPAPPAVPAPPEPSLDTLILRTAEGCEESFTQLYDLTVHRVHGLVLRVLRCRDQAAEVTQEVYVQIWRQADRYAVTRGSAWAWMATLAHRRAVDRVRSLTSDEARTFTYAARHHRREVDEVWDGVEQTLDAERVRRGLSSLTSLQREALRLTYYAGHTHAQAAQLLAIPVSTVKTRVRDGLIGLRQVLELDG